MTASWVDVVPAAEVDVLRSVNAELRSVNVELEAENCELRRRISELEDDVTQMFERIAQWHDWSPLGDRVNAEAVAR